MMFALDDPVFQAQMRAAIVDVVGPQRAESQNEQRTGKADKVPFLLENRLAELGGRFKRGEIFQPFALPHGNLVTAQNPKSSRLAAELMLIQLEDRGVKPGA